MWVTVMFAFTIAARPPTDPDMWWHLRSGQWMIEHRGIMRSDPFSYTSVGYHEPLEWLAQLGMYATWSAFGRVGMALAVATLAGLCAYLLYRACEGPPMLRVGVVATASLAALIGWTPRPQMLTWVFTAATVLAMAGYLRSGTDAARYSRRLWLLVPFFILWSNIHLCWFYGLAILWATVAGEYLEGFRGRRTIPGPALRSLAWVSLASSLAVTVNAVGPRIYELILTGGEIGKKIGIAEYDSPSLEYKGFWPFFALMFLAGILVVASWRRVSITDVGLLVGTGILAATTIRAIPLFAIVTAPVVTRLAAGFLARWEQRRTDRRDDPVLAPPDPPEPVGLGVKIAALAMVGLAALVTVRQRLQPWRIEVATRALYPVAATEWLRENDPPGALFNEYRWGGYLIWTLPDRPVGLDGRAEIYVGMLESLNQGEAATVFQRQQFSVVLTETNSSIAESLLSTPAWKVAYEDPTATVLVLRLSP